MFEIMLFFFGIFLCAVFHSLREEMRERRENKEVEQHLKNGTSPFI